MNPGLYVAVATRAFRRYSTYRTATLAGIFTNSVFGVIYSYAYLAIWAANPDAGGYDAVDAVTFVWLVGARQVGARHLRQHLRSGLRGARLDHRARPG